MADYYGGTGNDSQNGTTGADTFAMGAGNDTVAGGDGADYAMGDTGNDRLYGGNGADTLFGGDGDDQFYAGNDTGDSMAGGAGNDSIYGGMANDTGIGSSGNDYLATGDGNDLVYGGADQDTLYGGNGDDYMRGSTGHDTVQGDVGRDTVQGDTGNDTVDGGADNDSVYGGSGNDSLFGGTGNDVIYGDRVYIDPARYASTGANDTTITVQNNAPFAVDIWWIDGAGTPVYRGTIPAGGSFAQATGSMNYWMLTEAGTGTQLAVFSGYQAGGVFTYEGNFNDTIQGGAGDDTIYSDYGSDTIHAGDGNDQIYGAAGNDTVIGGNGNDNADLGAGDDSFGSFGDEAGQDTVYGGDGNDTLNGGGGNDLVYAGMGNDQLTGAAGNDTLYGGAGNDSISITDDHNYDSIDAGEGAGDVDWLNYSNFALTQGVSLTFSGTDQGSYSFSGGAWGDFSGIEAITGTGHADTLNAGADADGVWLFGLAGNDSIAGGSGHDLLEGGDGNDTILGGAGNDSATGGLGADRIESGAGDDTLVGDTGDDTLYFGTGNDIVYGGDGNDLIDDISGTQELGENVLYAGAGNDTLYTGYGADTVYAGADADAVSGEGGNDLVYGEGGDDTLFGGAGNDSLYGAAGNDGLLGDDDRDIFVIAANEGVDTVVGGEGGDDFDTLILTGSGATVTYTGAEQGTYSQSGGGSGSFFQIEAVETGTGNDTVDAATSNAGGTFTTGAGNDQVTGGAGNDAVYGGTGNDTLAGGGGNDTLSGGDGNDIVRFAGPVTDYSFDYVTGGGLIVSDSVAGRDGTDTLTGVERVEFAGKVYTLVAGDDGTNTTLQGPDDGTPSLIIAHDGNDWGGGHATSDAIFGGDGADTLEGGAGDDTLSGDQGNDLLRADAGNDALYGGTGNDTLTGGGGNDTLSGGDGNDRLTGEAGNDSYTTGAGQDAVILTAGTGQDTVTDFDLTLVGGRTTDQIDISDLRTPAGDPVRWDDIVVADDGSGNTVLTFPSGEQVTLMGVAPSSLDSKQEAQAMGLPCFARGTLILTPAGERPVESLRPGDLVMTLDRGPVPVVWAGGRMIRNEEMAGRPAARPVVIAPGALGNHLPLIVSPQHALLIRGPDGQQALVRAKHLAERKEGRFRHARGRRRIGYVHLMLAEHGLIWANGALAESLWPGPVALSGLGAAARQDIVAALPALRIALHNPDLLERIYGPRARVLLKARDLRHLSRIAAPVDVSPLAPAAVHGQKTTSGRRGVLRLFAAE